MKNHIIALTGFAGVGKNTVADFLEAHFGFRQLAFADSLRAEVAEGFGVDSIYLTRPETKNQPMGALAMRNAPTEFRNAVLVSMLNAGQGKTTLEPEWADAPRSPRQILQWWGTEYRRAQSPRYWTHQLTARAVYLHRDGNRRLVITDCRFPNEADTVLAMGGQIWQVTRPGIDETSTPEGAHVSATSGSAFKPSVVIANAHDKRHLQQLVLSEFVALETGIPTARVTVEVEA